MFSFAWACLYRGVWAVKKKGKLKRYSRARSLLQEFTHVGTENWLCGWPQLCHFCPTWSFTLMFIALWRDCWMWWLRPVIMERQLCLCFAFFFPKWVTSQCLKKNCHFTMFHCIYLRAHLLNNRKLYRCFYMLYCMLFFFFYTQKCLSPNIVWRQ